MAPTRSRCTATPFVPVSVCSSSIDLLATGGTVLGTIELVKQLKGEIVSLSFLVELGFLKGRERLHDYRINSVIAY